MLDAGQLKPKINILFDNRFIKNLPGDPEKENFRRQVHGACYSSVSPTKVNAPTLVAWSKEVAGQIGFSKTFIESRAFLEAFSGNTLLPGMEPYAMCYGGHQFGNWAGQLGDGRAINLGEVDSRGHGHLTLQLKGAGPTPYSRNADGLAVLRSSVREFLCSEAMFHLGVPTTRALSLVLTGEQVERDMFYDGHPQLEPGAVVCRVAPSFTRFGNFEILASRNDLALLKQLTDYTIRADFPYLGEPDAKVYLNWFETVCDTTASMVVDWMRVGFVHGVMNTDNMSILGQTIDYGPYGWLENYDPSWTPNTTDAATRRYSFGNQPGIAQWNLVKLAQAVLPLIGEPDPLQEMIGNFGAVYQNRFNAMMAQKLGISDYTPLTDQPLIDGVLSLLAMVETDYTIFFRALANLDMDLVKGESKDIDRFKIPLENAFYLPEQRTGAYEKALDNWLSRYAQRLMKDGRENTVRKTKMDAVNPKYVLRNYMAQLAIDKAQDNDFSMIHELMELLRHPYDEQCGKNGQAGGQAGGQVDM